MGLPHHREPSAARKRSLLYIHGNVKEIRRCLSHQTWPGACLGSEWIGNADVSTTSRMESVLQADQTAYVFFPGRRPESFICNYGESWKLY